MANENRTLLTKLVKGRESTSRAWLALREEGVDFLFLPDEREGENEGEGKDSWLYSGTPFSTN